MVQHFIDTRITFDSVQMFLFSLRMIYIISATKQRHFIHANKAHTIKIVLTFDVEQFLTDYQNLLHLVIRTIFFCKYLQIAAYLPIKYLQLPTK